MILILAQKNQKKKKTIVQIVYESRIQLFKFVNATQSNECQEYTMTHVRFEFNESTSNYIGQIEE